MKFSNSSIWIVFLLLVVMGCSNEDPEPPREGLAPISRLYVSTSDYESSAASLRLNNLFVLDPADSTVLDTTKAEKFTSGALGGNAVYFNPGASRVWQSGINRAGFIDTTIYIMSWKKETLPNGSVEEQFTSTGQIGNRKFTKVNAMAFSSLDRNGQLIVANSDVNSHLFVINSPSAGSGFKRPAYEIALDYTPRAMHLDSLDLYVSKEGVNGGIAVYKGFINVINSRVDTVINVTPTYNLSVSGGQYIAGLAYAKRSDILIMSDFDGQENNGRILVFKNFSRMLTSSTITPTQIIAGASTLMQKPVSVAIDNRRGGTFIYVADEKARQVLRFNVNDTGNVAPSAKTAVGRVAGGNTPVSIFLDSRGLSRNN